MTLFELLVVALLAILLHIPKSYFSQAYDEKKEDEDGERYLGE